MRYAALLAVALSTSAAAQGPSLLCAPRALYLGSAEWSADDLPTVDDLAWYDVDEIRGTLDTIACAIPTGGISGISDGELRLRLAQLYQLGAAELHAAAGDAYRAGASQTALELCADLNHHAAAVGYFSHEPLCTTVAADAEQLHFREAVHMLDSGYYNLARQELEAADACARAGELRPSAAIPEVMLEIYRRDIAEELRGGYHRAAYTLVGDAEQYVRTIEARYAAALELPLEIQRYRLRCLSSLIEEEFTDKIEILQAGAGIFPDLSESAERIKAAQLTEQERTALEAELERREEWLRQLCEKQGANCPERD